jgi:capsid protein
MRTAAELLSGSLLLRPLTYVTACMHAGTQLRALVRRAAPMPAAAGARDEAGATSTPEGRTNALTARDVEMLRMAAAVLDGSHDYDAQTVAAVSTGVAEELRAIARAHCSHVRVTDGVCRHCDATIASTAKDFEAGGGEAPHAAVGSQHPAAGFGPTSSPRGDR